MPEQIKITTRGELKAFLDSRPVEDAVAIALRAAWRVLPLVNQVDDDALFQRLTLAVFRATLVTQRGRSAATANAAANATATAAAYAATATADAANAAADAAANAAAANAAAYAADAAAYAAAANAAAYAADAAAYAADAAAYAAAYAADAATIWQAIEKDCRLLESQAAVDLHSEKMWYQITAPDWWMRETTNFTDRLSSLGVYWSVVDHWYKQLRTDASKDSFPNPVLADIAIERSRFWGDGTGNTRSPDDVMAEIAERLGWWLEKKWPPAVENIPSPYEVEWTENGTLKVSGDGLGRIEIPAARSPKDAQERLANAAYAAQSLLRDINSQTFQGGAKYKTSLEDYVEHLPSSEGGSIYVADTALRTLRGDVAEDLKYGFADTRLARRVIRLVEAHYAVSIYYPELQNLHADVQAGFLTPSMPVDEMDELGRLITATPDLFEQSIATGLEALEPNGPEPKPDMGNQDEVAGEDDLVMPPDPITDVDPVRAAEHARAGFFNRIWSALQKTEKAGKNIDRAEKTASTFANLFAKVSEFLSNLPIG